MDAVSIKNLSFTYAGGEAPALSGISLSLRRGESLALLGADGAGRSTLLCLLAGLMVRFFQGTHGGECLVEGASCVKGRPESVGLLLQDPFTQFSGMAFTVFDEVALGLEAQGASASRERGVWDVLDKVGAAHLGRRNPFSLSGGEAQRVALAALLVCRPRLLLLDEPFSQLDPGGREEMRRVIESLRNEGGTMILTGSDVGEVAPFADRSAVLCRGELVFDGPLEWLINERNPEAWGISLPLVTRLAEKARTMGLYEGPLPITPAGADRRWRL